MYLNRRGINSCAGRAERQMKLFGVMKHQDNGGSGIRCRDTSGGGAERSLCGIIPLSFRFLMVLHEWRIAWGGGAGVTWI